MAGKDMTEKALEAYNDVFADIVNTLVFHGREKMLEDELEQGRERSVYQGGKALSIMYPIRWTRQAKGIA